MIGIGNLLDFLILFIYDKKINIKENGYNKKAQIEKLLCSQNLGFFNIIFL